MKVEINNLLKFIFVFLLILCSGCWETKKTHSASFNGISAFGVKNDPLVLNCCILYSQEVEQASVEVLQKSFNKLSNLSPESRARYAADIGICALFANDTNLATKALDYSIANIESVTLAGDREKKVTSLSGSESQKLFKGEPYEKVMVYLYRGLLFMANSDYENAQACFKNAALQDAMAVEEKYRSNWITVDLLQLACKRLMQDPGASDFEAYIRQQYEYDISQLEHIINCQSPNLFLLMAVGQGPEKLAGESHGQRLTYSSAESRIDTVYLNTSQGTLVLPETDDLYLQAKTRGRRKMDELLAKKAGKRKQIETVGNVAAAAAPIVPGGVVLGLVKELSWSVSDDIDSSADCRQIRSIGRKLYLYVGTTLETNQTLKVQALNKNKQVVAEKIINTQSHSLEPVVLVGYVPY